MKTKGLTLTEIMISVSIVGLIAIMVIPAVNNFRETAYQNICRKNLQAINNAKLQWAVTEEKADDAEPTEGDMAGYIRGDFPQPVIAGALYTLNDVITPALCSFHGNNGIAGLGVTVSANLMNAINSSPNVSGSDVMDSTWVMDDNLFATFGDIFSLQLNSDGRTAWGGLGEGLVSSDEIEPEITINGKTLKGDIIIHYNEEYVETNRSYWESREDDSGSYRGFDEGCYESHLLGTSGGGYIVIDPRNGVGYQTTRFYDYKGELVSYIERHDGGVAHHFDDEGNLLNIAN